MKDLDSFSDSCRSRRTSLRSLGRDLSTPDVPRVERLWIMLTERNTDAFEAVDGMVITLPYNYESQEHGISIRAETVPERVGAVVFKINRRTVQRERLAPYTIAGDLRGDILKWKVKPGRLLIEAIPYTSSFGRGYFGTPKEVIIYFRVEPAPPLPEPTSTTPPLPSQTPTPEPTVEPTSTPTLEPTPEPTSEPTPLPTPPTVPGDNDNDDDDDDDDSEGPYEDGPNDPICCITFGED